MSSLSCCKRFPKEKELLDDGTFYYTPHRIGNTILLCGRKSSHFPFQLMVLFLYLKRIQIMLYVGWSRLALYDVYLHNVDRSNGSVH